MRAEPIYRDWTFLLALSVARAWKKELATEYAKRGRTYAERGVELQLPESHLVFRLPPDFTGWLAPDGTFKIFSADREVSCFVFVHGPGTPLPGNWMSAEFTIDGEKLVAAGELKHAQSDLVYRSFEGGQLLCYKFEKTNRHGAGLHGSAAGFKAEADRLTAFLKPFLSSFHRAEPASSPTTPVPTPSPSPAPPSPPPPPPSPAPIVTQDQRLHGLWYYSPTLRSGSDSMTMFRFRYFAYDGRFAQGGQSYATFVRRSSDGSWAGMDTLRSKLPPGERGTWETGHGVLTLNCDDQTCYEFSYYVEGNSLMLSQPGRGNQVWTRG